MNEPHLAGSLIAEPFDVCGPLPAGLALLEASAGTGKTFTIAALVTRYLAEGLPVDQILAITFTRAATGELRSRVREQLVAARDLLDACLAGEEPAEDDTFGHSLASGSEEQVRVRRDHLSAALAGFDAAAIETIHGFCHRVMADLGVSGDGTASETLVENIDDLAEEVVDDLYVRRFSHYEGLPPFDHKLALDIARAVLRNPDVCLEPERVPTSEKPTEAEAIAAMRRRLGDAVRAEVALRCRARGILTYDDVLMRLRDVLSSERIRPEARKRLRDRYRVVLVDEFQDTDPVQWEILARAFGDRPAQEQWPRPALVLIGDPKQAIYAFRGGDVHTYLAAAQTAGTVATLDVNWRSDENLLCALDALFGGARLGHDSIAYRSVQAARRNSGSRLSGAPCPAALRIRYLAPAAKAKKALPVGDARRSIAADMAADIAQLLGSGASIELERSAAGSSERLLRPGDVAVLVRKHTEASLVRDALQAARVPVVIGSTGSVFATEAAAHWLALIEALEQPTSRPRAAAAALGCFFDWSARELAEADDAALDELHAWLQEYSAILAQHGIAALFAAISRQRRLAARILDKAGGERFMTDLRHIAELLHEQMSRQGAGAAALRAWLEERRAEATEQSADDERSRRLESDVEAVQVITLHSAKGLEFPVVYCPFLWSGQYQKPAFPLFHDPDDQGPCSRKLDVGGAHAAAKRAERLCKEQARGEELRLAYVALTRARHQVVLWWAPANYAQGSALARLVFSEQRLGRDVAGGSLPTQAEAEACFEALRAAAGGTISVEKVDAAMAAPHYRPPETAAACLELARLDRALDRTWRRLSYSSLTAAAHDHRAPEQEEGRLSDEELSAGAPLPPGAGEALDASLATLLAQIPSPLGQAPAGADFGTLVHRVLERADFAAEDLVAELEAAITAELSLSGLRIGEPAALAGGLAKALRTPLGPGLGGITLAGLSRRDRLDEMGFELPLLGGDRPVATLELAQIAELAEAELDPADPMRSYAPRLADPAMAATLAGFLTGSVDLVLRTPDGRFALCDYKTNRLGHPEEPLSALHYRPAALAGEMERCHYPLQALFYLVALHRYLRWRIANYDPDVHLGGAHYLFLRGMTGDDRAQVGGAPIGVWSWMPPSGFIEAASGLLHQGAQR